MFSEQFIKKTDPQVDHVLEQTRSNNLKWQNKEFTERSWASWKISFSAGNDQREFLLEKEHFLEYGGWVSTDKSTLTVKNKNTGKESTHYYHESSDYVECLNASGYPGVSSLVRFVIDQFRSSMNLHWSIM